jgi:hypothetical protein
MFRCLEVKCLVALHVLVNVLERGWWGHRLHNTETQTMGLVRLMVRILTHNNHLNFLNWCRLETVKDQLFWWINLHSMENYLFAGFVLLLDELVNVLEGFALGVFFEWFCPAAQLFDELIVCQEKVALHGFI